MTTIPFLSDHYAFGAHKMPRPTLEAPGERKRWSEHMLCRALNLGTVVAFVGAGCSRPFDYPSWSKFASKILDKTLALNPPGYSATLERYKTLLRKRTRRPEELTSLIGTCKSLLLANNHEDYENLITELFKPAARHDKDLQERDPHRALCDLGIKRFVTPNYDVQLENSLIRERNLAPEDEHLKSLLADTCKKLRPGPKLPLRSFSQDSTNYEELALFALSGVRGSENAVFHCHGRF